MPKYRMALFDSDGTLANTLPWVSAAYNQLAAKYGFVPVGLNDHLALQHLTIPEMLRRTKVPAWRLPALVNGMRRLMAEHVHEFELFDGISDALQALSRAGMILGVVSSNSEDNVRAILGPANTALFQHFACSASIFGKTRKLRTVLRASGIPAQDTLYLGDEVRDAEAARAAGVNYGAVGWGLHSLEILRAQSPAEFFARPADIGRKLG